jgi:prolyl oligopeptidase
MAVNRALPVAAAAIATLLFACASVAQTPPATRTDDASDTMHGVIVRDPYRWLEDQESPETRRWIEAETRYTRSVVDALVGRDQIAARLTQLTRLDVYGVPTERNGEYFFSRRKADQDQGAIYHRHGLHGADEVLVDANVLDPTHRTSVGIETVSRDGTLLLYRVRKGGEDEIEVHFLDVPSRHELPFVMARARYESLSITPDKSRVYYTRITPEGPRAYCRVVSADGSEQEIFGKQFGSDRYMSVFVSEDGKYLVIVVARGDNQSKVYLQNLAANGPIAPIVDDIDAAFDPVMAGDRMLLLTNWQAPRKRVLSLDPERPSRSGWREIVPQSDAIIDSIDAVGGRLVVRTLRNATSKMSLLTVDGKPVRDIDLPVLGTVGGATGRWDGSEVFYSFSSFAYPYTAFHYDVATGKQDVFFRLQVPVDTSRLAVDQVWYASRDGTRVPMFLVHAKGMNRDGKRPTILYGYGGFDVSMTPHFDSQAIMIAERGGVYALPNLRGGGEFGEDWHKAGMLAKKQNVFDDFIAAARWLIANRYTDPNHLAISGGSNGGLLVGAALTQRPDLFKAVVCWHPLLDMVRYDRFMLGPLWVPEYGSPADADMFKALYAYSPYHHIKRGVRYPAVYFETGDGDTRVAPLHARKMAALLQASTASGPSRPILIRYDTLAGHSGGQPVSKIISDQTDEVAFLWWQLGIK